MGTHPIFESDFDCLTERMKLLGLFVTTTLGNLLDGKNIRIRQGNSRLKSERGSQYKQNTEYNERPGQSGPVNRLQCFFHPRWINCRSRANMRLRPAPGKGMPICPYGCGNGKCVEKCLFGRCKKECQCEDGFEGLRCEQDVNDCRRNTAGKRPCEHKCVNLNGYFRCMCEEGYQLGDDERSCKRVKSLCDLKNCEMDCFERYGQAYCTCPKPGLKLAPDERTCVDDNECEVDGIGLCKTREVCVNFYGGYRCDCEQGYARQGQSPICSDIDECQLGLAECPPGTKCRNVPGFYQCHENIKIEERDEMPQLTRSAVPVGLNRPAFREEKPLMVDFVYNKDISTEDYLDAPYAAYADEDYHYYWPDNTK